jgi:hypothetical protein
MASTIGIKVANGEFYPIMEENSAVKKRLILTTVHDDQKSVQIDLYNSNSRTMADALYVGSLVVDNIKPQSKGGPSIEMTLVSNAAGELSVDVVDLEYPRGEHQHLSVSLASMTEDTADGDLHDFELDTPEHPPRGLYEKAAALKEDKKKKAAPWILVAVATLLLLAIGSLLYYFFLNDTGIAMRTGWFRGPAVSAPAAAPLPVTPVPEVQTPAPVTPVPAVRPDTVPVISSAPKAAASGPSRTRTRPPVASYKVPQTIPKEGAPYKIRWGDTLWDISEAFYRNPWLYRRIAQFNNIRNPNLIISGRTIRIPPRK